MFSRGFFLSFQLPVITNLRNPALKPRHWEHIQQIFGYHFTEEEPLTLGLLNKIDAFDHTEAIEEVSGQASSEASLEGILKKVTIKTLLDYGLSRTAKYSFVIWKLGSLSNDNGDGNENVTNLHIY